MGRPLFSGWATLLIALGLIVPECLRNSSKSLEPYPAVIMPKGSGTLDVENGQIRLNRIFATGVRQGEWQRLDVGELMFPISEHYFGRLAGRNFGLERSEQPSPAQAAREQQAKNFLRERLAAQGFETQRFRLVEETLTIALPSGKLLSTHVRKKTTHALD